MEKIEALVKGGHASAAPPLGPALGPTGVNIGEVINAINDKTKEFEGMEVPVKVMIDSKTKKFDIVVGTPPVSSLLKKELKVDKLARKVEENYVPGGDITLMAVIKIAKGKSDAISGDLKAKVKQVLGTCLSCGVTVDGKDAREVQKEIDAGLIRIE